MFVKIENFANGKPLIINVDNIVSIYFSEEENTYIVCTIDKHYYCIEEQQYTELCKILTTRL